MQRRAPGSARRAQVAYAVGRGVSERRACALLRVARSALGYASRVEARNAPLVARLTEIAEQPRAGDRRAWALLRREGGGVATVNATRVHRLWRAAGLSLPPRRPRRERPTGRHVSPAADRPNAVWTYDVVHDACANGQALKGMTVVDEYTKESLRIEVDGRLHSGRVIGVLRELVAAHGAPQHLRSDNGPEFVARAVQRWLREAGITTAYIASGKPWQNGVGERFNGTLRAECLDQEWFHSRAEARVVIEPYRRFSNEARPHSSIASRTPAELGATRPQPPAPASDVHHLNQRRAVA